MEIESRSGVALDEAKGRTSVAAREMNERLSGLPVLTIDERLGQRIPIHFIDSVLDQLRFRNEAIQTDTTWSYARLVKRG